MPQCLKCGAELVVNEEGIAPVLCDRCAGRATSRARRGLNAGTLLNFPATTLLIAINVSVFLAMPIFGVNPLDPSGRGLILFGANYGPLTVGGEYWRLLTNCFVHIGILHIALNMWCLWGLGRLAERLFGRWQTLCIYLVTGAGGSLLSIAHGEPHISAGASSALFGIAGALIAGLKFGDFPVSWREQRGTLSSVMIFTILSLVWGMQSPDIDNMAHLGGLVSGLLVGLPLGAFSQRHKLLQLATILATVAVLLFAGHELVNKEGEKGFVTRVVLAMRDKDYAKAASLLEQYTAANPADDEALVMLGDAYEKNNQKDRAVAAYQKALKANPKSEEAKQALEGLSSENEDNPARK
jgi:rhomboid protease GluP